MSCDSQLALLRGALAAAVAEIDEHNAEYKYKTPKEKLDYWRLLYSGEGPSMETPARLDGAGFDLPRWEDDGGAIAGELDQ